MEKKKLTWVSTSTQSKWVPGNRSRECEGGRREADPPPWLSDDCLYKYGCLRIIKLSFSSLLLIFERETLHSARGTTYMKDIAWSNWKKRRNKLRCGNNIWPNMVNTPVGVKWNLAWAFLCEHILGAAAAQWLVPSPSDSGVQSVGDVPGQLLDWMSTIIYRSTHSRLSILVDAHLRCSVDACDPHTTRPSLHSTLCRSRGHNFNSASGSTWKTKKKSPWLQDGHSLN